MKVLITTSFILLLCFHVIAQKKSDTTKTKPVKFPTQSDMKKEMSELEKMMKEMEGEMSEEDKKMMESMGIKMPDIKQASKNLSGISDKQLAAAWEEENILVPKKNSARIAAIPKVPKSQTTAYLKSLHQQVSNALPKETVEYAEKVYNYCIDKKIPLKSINNISVGFWLNGKPGIAVYLLGKVIDQVDDVDSRSNYASQLSMLGAGHLAMPILTALNVEYPKNSTHLNNLGQAWFQLGDITQAEKFLDSAIALYPLHGQANLTKSKIEENKGNKKKAIECIKKSLQDAYTKEKEDILNRLGVELTLMDLRFPFRSDGDPLSINKIKRPDYPMNSDELRALKPQWEEFNDALAAEIAQLEKRLENKITQFATNASDMVELTIESVKNGTKVANFPRPPLYAKKANLILQELVKIQEKTEKKLAEKFATLKKDLQQIEKEYILPDPEEPCSVHRDAFNTFISKYHARKKAYDDELIATRKKILNEIAYWDQYINTDPVMHEAKLIQYRIMYLKALTSRLDQPVLNGQTFENCPTDDEEPDEFELQDFANTPGCKYRSELNFGIFKMTSNCNLMNTEFDFMFLNVTRKDDFDRAEGDNYVSSTIKVSAEVGKDISMGTLKAEAKLGLGVEVALDRNGLQDVFLIGEAKLAMGNNVLDDFEAGPGESTNHNRIGANVLGKDAKDLTYVSIGTEGRVSILSGHGTLTGTGVLSGVEMATW